MKEEGVIQLLRCESCQGLYLPGNGPCPRCGSRTAMTVVVPSIGTVLAGTELMNPAPGWTTPHRIALVELSEAVRLLGVVDGPLPVIGDTVNVRREGPIYRLTVAPAYEEGGRGEGDLPKVGGFPTSL